MAFDNHRQYYTGIFPWYEFTARLRGCEDLSPSASCRTQRILSTVAVLHRKNLVTADPSAQPQKIGLSVEHAEKAVDELIHVRDDGLPKSFGRRHLICECSG